MKEFTLKVTIITIALTWIMWFWLGGIYRIELVKDEVAYYKINRLTGTVILCGSSEKGSICTSIPKYEWEVIKR